MILEDNYRYKGMRKSLVKQLRDKGIKTEQVLEAIQKVPRHFFFDDTFLEYAYEDKAFPIEEGQTISQPYTVAFQTELLAIQKNDKVLEVGTGSGYQSCILLELGAKVFTVEYQKKLYQRVKDFLPTINYYPRIFWGDGTKGLPQFMPYNKIIVTAGAPAIPPSLIHQLKEGGILVIPVGSKQNQIMIRITKKYDNQFKKENFHTFSFVPLRGEEGWHDQ
ncbi:MAG: protein-L-isoaspartate(D-aspartate) O-methyltransferase [Cytophagales bacterium]|nr:protein-L-isoaspartate(D-aspartate) O-methyltransferase [Cytophagales bacterium]